MLSALVAAITPDMTSKEVYELPEAIVLELALKCHMRRAATLPAPEESNVPIPDQVKVTEATLQTFPWVRHLWWWLMTTGTTNVPDSRSIAT